MNIPLVQSMIKAIDKPAIFIDLNYSILAVNQAYRDTYSQVVQTGKSKCYEVSQWAISTLRSSRRGMPFTTM